MTKLKTLNDTELVLQYQETMRADILGELYQRHHKNLVSFCYKRINEWEIAKDLTQDVFIKISQKLNQLKEPHAFLKWMYQVARNTCMDFLRANKKMKMTDLTEVEHLSEDADSYAEVMEKEAMMNNVSGLIEHLEPLSRTLLIEKYYGKKTILDLSDEYGLSKSAVKMRLFRTKKRVEMMFQKQTLAVA